MGLIAGMAVLTCLGMAVIWVPPYRRHPHMRAMDRLAEQHRKDETQ